MYKRQTPKSEFVPLPGHTLSNSTNSIIKNDTPQSSSGLDPTFSASSIINVTSELSLAGKPVISGADIAVSDISDATNDTSDAFYADIDPVLSGSLRYASVFRAGLESTRLNIPAEYSKHAPITQPLNEHKGNSESTIPSSPASFESDLFAVSGQNMSDRWPRVFNELSERAYVATTRPDGSQIPQPWLCLINGMPLLSDCFWFHLFVKS